MEIPVYIGNSATKIRMQAKRMRSSALLTGADYGIRDFSLIISPSTANLPYP